MGKAPTTLSITVLDTMRGVLKKLEDRFPVVHSPELARLVNYSGQANNPIHRWFRYREGYSISLVEKLLQDISPGKLVIDPFCGAGTTLLGAAKHGFASVGLDANPFSVLVAKTKTRKYTLSQLKQFENTCSLIQRLRLDDPYAEKPQLEIIDKIFLPEVLHALLIIKHFIDHQLISYERDFFFLGWLSILEEVSNVFREGNGIKYRNRKRTPLGYIDIPMDLWQVSMFTENRFQHVIDTFLERVMSMMQDILHHNIVRTEPNVLEGDAISLSQYIQPLSASLVAFSPPYLNNFNYFKAYKVELWMGGFISSYNELRELTRQSLRSHVETRLKRESDISNVYPKEIDILVDLMDINALWTQRIPQVIRGYFYDMRDVLQQSYDVLDYEGKCAIVVGNSAYGSVLVPTDLLLAEVASDIGFEVDKIAIARHLTTSSQQKNALAPLKEYLRESILILKKPKNSSTTSLAKNPEANYKHVEELPTSPNKKDIYVIRNRGLTNLTHNIHKYPGRFIPHIPRWAIDTYLGSETGKTILDPFCGSGTSLVEARIAGHHAYGIDIDPIARIISKVKTTPIISERLWEAVNSAIYAIEHKNRSHFRPSIDTLDHWFLPSVSNDLGVIREVIDQWKHTDNDIYDFFIVCLSAIIRQVSNADNQSLKTYVSGTHRKSLKAVRPLFIQVLKDYANRINQLGDICLPDINSKILNFDDARDFADNWFIQGYPLIDLAITSPPYIKTIDYIYSQMVEYFWIGDLFNLENQTKQNIAKKRYIGTEKISSQEYSVKEHTGIESIDSFIDDIYVKSPKHAYILSRYFIDMRYHFRQMHKVLHNNSNYIVVIGDSSINKIEIPTHKLLSEIARVEGFVLQSDFAYEIRNRYMRFPRNGRGGIIHLDWILTLQKLNK